MDAAEDWLFEEASAHLREFGPYGLYEFLWTLNGSRFRTSAVQARHLSQRVAGRLAHDLADLYRVRWPTHAVVSDRLPLSVLDNDESWQVGDEFVALVPRDMTPPHSIQDRG